MTEPQQIPTPKTDAEKKEGWNGDAELTSIQFTEGLERELHLANAKIEELKKERDETSRTYDLCKENATNAANQMYALLDENKALREAVSFACNTLENDEATKEQRREAWEKLADACDER